MNPAHSPHNVGRLFLVALAMLVFTANVSAQWKEKVLYSFQGGTSDGSDPVGGVVFDSQGNLYGVLQAYGPASCAPIGNECGAVFQLAPPAHKGDPWTETLIYKFQGKGANDGESPNGGLLIDGGGNLYGVTAYGGTGNCVLLGVSAGCGTVYELSPPKQKGGAWTETLYSFPTSEQGYVPIGDLVFDGAGNHYGATLFGGGKGTTCDPYYQYCGAVFELSPPKTKGGKWTEKVLHAFAGGTDGLYPNGGLVLDSKGVIYGTTDGGGGASCQGSGCGTAFALEPPARTGGAWREKILHRFIGGNDGETPNGGLIFDAKGALYGTTINGGPGFFGTVFKLSPPNGHNRSWTEGFLHTFMSCNPTVPCEPNAGVIFDSAGNLYGTATNFLIRLKPPVLKGGNWSLAVLYEFKRSPDGSGPGDLIFGSTGAIYGATGAGGTSDNGTVFQAAP
jgi:uncharacterized repeat protein (TIGR03803 family)